MSNQEPVSPAAGVFPARRRGILRYFDGESDVHGDPLEIQRRLVVHCRESGVDFESEMKSLGGIEDDDPDADAAYADVFDRLMPSIRHAFRMPPVDPATGKGALVAEAIEAFTSWLVFMNDVKKNIEAPPSGSPSTAGPRKPRPRKPKAEPAPAPAPAPEAAPTTTVASAGWSGAPQGMGLEDVRDILGV
jgi:hypothetical protein